MNKHNLKKDFVKNIIKSDELNESDKNKKFKYNNTNSKKSNNNQSNKNDGNISIEMKFKYENISCRDKKLEDKEYIDKNLIKFKSLHNLQNNSSDCKIFPKKLIGHNLNVNNVDRKINVENIKTDNNSSQILNTSHNDEFRNNTETIINNLCFIGFKNEKNFIKQTDKNTNENENLKSEKNIVNIFK